MLRPDDHDQVAATLRLLEEFERAGAEHAILGFASPPSRSLLESLAV
jgi:hypothetical protein